ncbi:MAG: VWA domain-containing protein [Phycicoccus sp.]|nr:VWA domain-containing protein [Phycicoccus sp.]
MTDPQLTHIEFILDRSGSMASIKGDIEGGFDSFVAGQRSAPGRCTVSLAQFDDHYEVVYTDLPLADVPALTLQPRGSTAMLDAIGRSMTTLGQRLAALPEDARPGTVIVAIVTDGLENASREWTRPAIKALIEHQSRGYSWQFLYLGADQDAVEVGTGMGIPADRALTYSRGNSRVAMAAGAAMVSGLRSAKASGQPFAHIGFSDSDRTAAVDDGDTPDGEASPSTAHGIRLPPGRFGHGRA